MEGSGVKIGRICDTLLTTTPQICIERARLVTDSYRKHEDKPAILRRANALRNVLMNMSIYMLDGELIVGNQASKPRSAPIFPEYSIDWIREEIDDFPRRKADVFLVDDEDREELLEEILLYWEGKTVYDRALAIMPEMAKKVQEISVISGLGNITSGDGHIIVDFPLVINKGLKSIIDRVNERIANLDLSSHTAIKERIFLDAVKVVLEAAIAFAERYANETERLARMEDNPSRKEELLEIARICRKVPAYPSETFYEDIPAIWFIQVINQIESNGHSFSLGRLDQYLYPLV